jgi:hypothetical protein
VHLAPSSWTATGVRLAFAFVADEVTLHSAHHVQQAGRAGALATGAILGLADTVRRPFAKSLLPFFLHQGWVACARLGFGVQG